MIGPTVHVVLMMAWTKVGPVALIVHCSRP
jgi:hypothetical protein